MAVEGESTVRQYLTARFALLFPLKEKKKYDRGRIVFASIDSFALNCCCDSDCRQRRGRDGGQLNLALDGTERSRRRSLNHQEEGQKETVVPGALLDAYGTHSKRNSE